MLTIIVFGYFLMHFTDLVFATFRVSGFLLASASHLLSMGGVGVAVAVGDATASLIVAADAVAT